ncbi:MAG: right-handed parallel beta-helix repeat-containing protein [Planctomycetes bacterium]|nr:right-handed parallel beta-helix repeat-containing protein [Planctomycetota bacterium]
MPIPRRFLPFALAFLAGCGSSETPERPPAPREIVIDRDDIDVTESVVVRPGTYRVADRNGDGVLRVKSDDVTVDLTGVTLIGSQEGAAPDAFEGIGVRVDGREGVVVRGGAIRGFRGAVYFKTCLGGAVEGVDVSDNRAQRLKSTPSRCDDGADWLAPHFNDQNEWFTSYGAGITLDGGHGTRVSGCRGRRTQNGIVLRNAQGSRIVDNDMSWMSGWGIALWRSSRNEISHNRCDYGVRGYSHGVYDRGQDSAGILMFEQCSDNVIAMNSATHGGDGIFMYAGHETTQVTGEGGCNRNLLWRNDFSHAVANAIECTFSDGNRFVENVLDDSNYGVWAGYSYDTKIVGNTCRGARVAGVAIEHGHDNLIEGNLFEKCGDGVQLWWDDDGDFLNSTYGKKRDCSSARNTVALNRFVDCRRAFWIAATSETTIARNEFAENRNLGRVEGNSPGFEFEFNRVLADRADTWIVNATGTKMTLGPNRWPDGKAPDSPDIAWALPIAVLHLDFAAVSHREPVPDLRGTLDAMLPKDAARGMATIVVDEWGPCDPSVAKLFPQNLCAWNEAELHLLGPAGTFEVLEAAGDVHVEPRSGTAPATLRVLAVPKGDPPHGVVCPFSIRVRTSAGAVLEARGTLIDTSWNVEFWAWEPRDGDHGGYLAALDAEPWKTLTATPPLATAATSVLRRPWESAAIPRDHFADRATTRLRLTAGRWRFTTTSDDGVRVLVDGKPVIENWTWHAPATDVAEADLAEGVHEIVVEHFEIDGYEALELAIEPAR